MSLFRFGESNRISFPGWRLHYFSIHKSERANIMFGSAAHLTSLFLIAVLCSVVLMVNSLWLSLWCALWFQTPPSSCLCMDENILPLIIHEWWSFQTISQVNISEYEKNDKVLDLTQHAWFFCGSLAVFDIFVVSHVTSLLTSLSNCRSRLNLLYAISALLSYMSWTNPFNYFTCGSLSYVGFYKSFQLEWKYCTF